LVSGTQTLAQDVEQAVLPVLARDGYELVQVEYVPRQRVLRLFVDHVARSITVDDCARISHVVGDLLDAEGLSDKIPGRYHLEVSSPGLDRPLVKPRDFARFVGKRAQVTTHELTDGRRNFTGELAAADEQGFRIVVDGQPYSIAYAQVAKAKLVPEL
jgi:ribosome maturation factor RimP